MRSALRRAAAAAMLVLALGAAPAAAFSLFATHEVTVQFATPDGKPMANAPVRVFAPGKPDKPVLTGQTDSNGEYQFAADRDGFWSAEARSGKEVARVMIRVGGEQQQQSGAPISPYWAWGGLFLLLVLAFGYRILRARARARRPKG